MSDTSMPYLYGYCDYLRAAGRSPHTIALRKMQVRALLEDHPDPWRVSTEDLTEWLAGHRRWSKATRSSYRDGLGSIAIGLAMMVGAILLMKDVRDLIVGKSVDKDTSRRIIRAATSIDGVNKVLDLRTMYLGSEKLLVILEVHIQDDLDTDTIEKITDIIKTKVQRLVPIAQHIQIEIETPDNE